MGVEVAGHQPGRVACVLVGSVGGVRVAGALNGG